MLKNNYKTALVTGASSGIGEETVKLLVKNNIKVSGKKLLIRIKLFTILLILISYIYEKDFFIFFVFIMNKYSAQTSWARV